MQDACDSWFAQLPLLYGYVYLRYSCNVSNMCRSARALVEEPELSIFQATNGLSRHEAAKFFHHVLGALH